MLNQGAFALGRNPIRLTGSVPTIMLASSFISSVRPFTMEVTDRYVSDELFTEFLSRMPQVCVELVLETEDGVLLCKRETKPHVWFWPGSRLYKGERLESAARRVAREELGVEVKILERLGVQDHFWKAQETSEGVSRHTVNIVYRASPMDPEFTISLDDQHSDHRFVTDIEPEMHEYVREYLLNYEIE